MYATIDALSILGRQFMLRHFFHIPNIYWNWKLINTLHETNFGFAVLLFCKQWSSCVKLWRFAQFWQHTWRTLARGKVSAANEVFEFKFSTWELSEMKREKDCKQLDLMGEPIHGDLKTKQRVGNVYFSTCSFHRELIFIFTKPNICCSKWSKRHRKHLEVFKIVVLFISLKKYSTRSCIRMIHKIKC